MKQYYRSALEHGGDQVTIALGKAERLLVKAPKDAAARAYKGSLLAMIGETMSSRQSGLYLKNGVAMMKDVLSTLDPTRFDDVEAYFVAVTGLLRLSDTVPDAAISAEMLTPLLMPDCLALLTEYEAITVLVLDAIDAEKTGDVARAADRMQHAMKISVRLTTLIRSDTHRSTGLADLS